MCYNEFEVRRDTTATKDEEKKNEVMRRLVVAPFHELSYHLILSTFNS